MAEPVEEEMPGLPDPNIRRLKTSTDENNLPSSDDSSVSSLDSDEILTDDDETPTDSSGVQNKFNPNPAVSRVTTNKFYRPTSVNNLSRSHSLKNSTRPSNYLTANGSRRLNGHSHTNSDTSFIRSVSELNLNREGNTRKKLSLDVEKLEDAISLASTKTQTSIFRSIGSWFRGSTRSQLSSFSFKLSNEDKSSTQEETPTPPATYNTRKINSPPVVGTAFATFADTNPPAPPPRRKKKKLRFSDFDNDNDAAWNVDTSTDDSSDEDEYGADVGSDDDGDVKGGGESVKQHAAVDVDYELRCTSSLQCRHFNRHFRKSPGVKVTNKQLSHQLFADALVVPGNSFGFLDGEPEIRYVEIFGWQIQEELRKMVNEEFDGELLVGQSVILNLESGENKKDKAAESGKQTEEKAKSNGNEAPNEQELNGKIETNETLELNGESENSKQPVGVDGKTIEKEDNSHNDSPSSLNNNKPEEMSSERVVDMKKHKKIDMDVGDADDIDDIDDNRPTVKYLVYVPIMRVPSLVPDTVNSYLAFRAALLAVKKFNAKQSDESLKIKSVICPPLCDGFGEMPPGRIAFQMKSAYDTFALGLSKFPDYQSDDLGRLATDHVKMCSMKDGSWC